MKVTVREMDSIHDMAVVFELFGILHQEHSNMFAARGIRMHPPAFAIDDFNIDIIECDGKTAGLIATRRSTSFENMGTIADIILYPQYRGNGVGTMVLERAFEEMRENGLTHVNLNVMADNKAMGLYRRLGFEPRSIFMTKEL